MCRAYVAFLVANTVYNGGWTKEVYEVALSSSNNSNCFQFRSAPFLQINDSDIADLFYCRLFQSP